jgi:hypothetical protein
MTFAKSSFAASPSGVVSAATWASAAARILQRTAAQLEHALPQALQRQSINQAGPSGKLRLRLHDIIPEVAPEVAAPLASAIGRDAASVPVVWSCDAVRVLREVSAAATADLAAAPSRDDIPCYAVADASALLVEGSMCKALPLDHLIPAFQSELPRVSGACVPESLSAHLSVAAAEMDVQDRLGIAHACSALGVVREEPQLEHRLSNIGVSVLRVGRHETQHEQRLSRHRLSDLGVVHAFSALGVGREPPQFEHCLSDLRVSVLGVGHQEPLRGHRLSDLAVATSVLDVACREVP